MNSPDAKNVHGLLKKALCTISPALYSKYLFRRILGRNLDLNNPEGMDAKLAWLKLHTYRDDPLVTQCSDKYCVREYVKNCGCESTLNDLYAVWRYPEEIDWDSLPKAFVLKCNHGSGYNLICLDKDKIDRDAVADKLRAWLNEDYWMRYAEMQYRNIPKRILCEKYLGDSLIDYKIYCFNGVPKYILACVGRDEASPSHTEGQHDPRFFFFDTNWNLCPLTKDGLEFADQFSLSRPDDLEKMLDVAAKLCRPFPFVRVDLYDVSGTVVFGELTFTPSAAMDTGRLPETDRFFGSLLVLPEKK